MSKSTGQLDRRRFLKKTALATGTAALATTIVPSSCLGRDGAVAPSERIVVGGIGIGRRGTYDLSCFLPQPDVQFVAVCDVKAKQQAAIKNIVDRRYGNQDCATYRDFRELLGRDDIDAVLIATGPNWHATAAMYAARAGKDMYCEKPCTKNIAQSLTLADTMRRTGRVFQAGTQRRNLPHFAFACELARTGKLGKLKAVHAHPAGMSTRSSGWMSPEPEPPAEQVDWDLYLGPAAWRPFNKKHLDGFNFEKGGGLVGGGVLEWGSHCVDLCQWAVGADNTAPVEYNPPQDGRLVARYENGVELVIRNDGWLPLGSCPVRFEGETGWVEAGDSGKLVLSSPELLAGHKVAEIGGYPATFHVRDFLDCVKSRSQPKANAEAACYAHIACHAANNAIFLGRQLKYDLAKHEFIGDEQANRLRSEALRAPVEDLSDALPHDQDQHDIRITIMQTTRLVTRCVACLATMMLLAATARAADGPEATKQRERELIAVLQSDAPAADKAITCKSLAVYGSPDAVPALAPLLADQRLASWARIALEAIPGPAADEALRQAVGQQQGRLLIGAINSLGVRRDGQAVDALSRHLNGKDPEVAAAAAVALGKIGSDPASRTLRQALAKAPETVRSAVAEGCILCAEQLLAHDKAKEAAEIYDEVRRAQITKQWIVAATRGAILARGSAGAALLVEQLKSDDRELFRSGLMVARELPGRAVADALAAELAGMPAERGALLVLALADRSDTVVSPAMLAAAGSGPKKIRLAAIGLVRRSGDASCVPTLLQVALESDEELAQSAKDALAQLSGPDVNAAITSRLSQAEGPQLALLIDVVGQRRMDVSTSLLKHVDHADAKIRRAALTALGETVGPDSLAVLIQRVAEPKRVDDAPVAQQALRAACVRMPDREACAAQLAAAMPRAPSSAKRAYLETLGAMGGTKALLTIHTAAKGDDPELQDVGSRLLGEWMTVDAAPALFDLTTTAPEEKFKVRALRGYIRLARQFSMPNDQRAEICDQALAAARRSDEQQLVLQVLERYPSIEMLRIAVKATKTPALKEDATRVAMTIAQKLGGTSAGAKELLAQIGQTPVKLEIVRAAYGAGSNQIEVTQLLRKHAGGLRLIALPSPKYNTNFGVDPAPGAVKQLKIDYRIDGKAASATFAEDSTILLPLPK